MVQLKPQKEVTRDWPKTWSVPTLVVRCIVFNHGKFIERCLQGFLMQETNFPFEVFVHDDASTDESAEIIRRYAERYPLILKPVYENENQYSKKDGSFFRTTWQPVIQGGHKYIALCEGDDYWTDPKKLQKQVEYMEGHPGCAGCFHERVKCDAEGRIMEGTELPEEMKRVLTGDDIASQTYPLPPTCTMMYRREALMNRPEWLNAWTSGDLAALLWSTYFHGTVDWVDGVKPSVYRIHAGGVWSGKGELQKIAWEHEVHRSTMEHFPVSRHVCKALHLKMGKEVFWLWRRYHGSDVPEEREKLQMLVRQAVTAWPPLRWKFGVKRIGYWLERGRALVWHGVVLGIKGIVPNKLYLWLHRLLKGKSG